ncbi:MAG: DNA polymerase III subunit alpha, partial [Bacteroidota bacterium]
DLIREYKEGLIATTCCLASEVNQAILKKGEVEAEKLFLEWLDIFGEDYYIEIQRHDLPEQNICNEVLLRWSKKHNVKVIATNDVHYVDVKDAEAQDILLCLQTGKDFDDPNRMRFENNRFFLKTKEEMEELFKDVPDALENTQEIIDKIDSPKITRDILLPVYQLPQGFTSEIEYLKYISFEGAKKRYSSIPAEVEERLNFELNVIKDMGFAGYFLIVQDFTTAARNLGVSVGPGRGSAAGSLVAYCIGIINIDPIKYDLLFERFLNPERISMPDIDIDFDEDGRQKVIDYVVEKYGKDKVAQIVTFGTMAAKSSIKDVARVLGLPLHEADRLTKLLPDELGVNLRKSLEDVKELKDELNSANPLIKKTLEFAGILEGSARHTGIHAAGVIIAPDKLENYVPLCTAKDAELLVTQYDGKYVESVGMLKMDFLGLKTLNIITDCIENIFKINNRKI